jgi:hypothetical protein
MCALAKLSPFSFSVFAAFIAYFATIARKHTPAASAACFESLSVLCPRQMGQILTLRSDWTN